MCRLTRRGLLCTQGLQDKITRMLITMNFLLPQLTTKAEVDAAIKSTEDVVVVLRFGREGDAPCLQLDDVLSKAAPELARMAAVYCVDVDKVPVYRQYFDITLIPATIFFFNGQHMKVDWGTADHTKFIGSFKKKQHFVDVVEVIYRGAMKGRLMVRSPLDPADVPKYELLYQDY